MREKKFIPSHTSRDQYLSEEKKYFSRMPNGATEMVENVFLSVRIKTFCKENSA